MRVALVLRVFLTVIAPFAAGCSSSSGTGGGAQDSATSDTGVADSAHGDTPVDGGGDGSSGACGDKTCSPGQLCVRQYVTGGACLNTCGDGGPCPTGMKCDGFCCVADPPAYSYSCKDVPSSCAAALSCATCGTDLCAGGCGQCEAIDGNVVTCHCLAP
jgi:hypothetical protein